MLAVNCHQPNPPGKFKKYLGQVIVFNIPYAGTHLAALVSLTGGAGGTSSLIVRLSACHCSVNSALLLV